MEKPPPNISQWIPSRILLDISSLMFPTVLSGNPLEYPLEMPTRIPAEDPFVISTGVSQKIHPQMPLAISLKIPAAFSPGTPYVASPAEIF